MPSPGGRLGVIRSRIGCVYAPLRKKAPSVTDSRGSQPGGTKVL